jgi:hypothetical protein
MQVCMDNGPLTRSATGGTLFAASNSFAQTPNQQVAETVNRAGS